MESCDGIPRDSAGEQCLPQDCRSSSHNRAARVVLVRSDQLNGGTYHTLTTAADALEVRHPVAAMLMRRAMVQDTLEGAKSKRYRYAACHLADCQSSEPAIADHAGFPTHAQFIETLRQKRGRKYGLSGSWWAHNCQTNRCAGFTETAFKLRAATDRSQPEADPCLATYESGRTCRSAGSVHSVRRRSVRAVNGCAEQANRGALLAEDRGSPFVSRLVQSRSNASLNSHHLK